MRNRKRTRLKHYDYSCEGVYFITVCVRSRESIFGEIKDGEMICNEYGGIVNKCWSELAHHYNNCTTDEFVVMPNHVHGIIMINDYVGNRHACSLQQSKRQYQQLPIIIGSLKSVISKIIRRKGLDHFQWQKSYYDRVIRNNTELEKIREYIQHNPINWQDDEENPKK